MSALTSHEFTALMADIGGFEACPILAIATSGGPDSLALTLLAHQWAQDQGGKIVALTVDHRLREASTTEAHQVASWLKDRGIDHHILTWKQDQKPTSALQATARKARYDLLSQWCQGHGIKYLLTAHHAEDQLETFLIRLAKGSGLKGLTSIQKSVPTPFGRLLRPLLTVEASRLKKTLQSFQQPFFLDPSNENTDFTRVRWRKLLPLLAEEGLTSASLQETLSRLDHTQRLIDQHITSLFQKHVTFSPYGYATLSHETLFETPEALEEILKNLFAAMGTRTYPVRRHALHRALEAMKKNQSFTLSGCQILHKPKAWQIIREPSAVQKELFIPQPGSYIWDHRFIVEVSEHTPCTIASLGIKGARQLKEKHANLFQKVPSRVLQTLPALWKEGLLIDVFPSYTFTLRSW